MAGIRNSVLFGDNVDFTGTPGTTPMITQDGDLLIGATAAPNIRTGSITSGDGSVTITKGAGTLDLQVTGGTTTGKTITGSSGGPLSPIGGNWDILGSGSITTSGSGSTLTITASDASETQKGVVELATDAETTQGTDTARAIVPSALKAKLGVQTAKSMPFGAGDSSSLSWTNALTNGQIVIGSTAGTPQAANITSTGSSITVTNGSNSINLETGGAVATSYTADVGSAVPAAGVLTVAGGSNINTAGAVSTLTVNLDANITVDSLATSNTTTGLTINNNSISADGTDANIDINVTPKNTGFTVLGNPKLSGNLQGDGFDIIDVINIISADPTTNIQTHIHNGDSITLQGYDVGGASYDTFLTMTAGTPPTCDLSDSVTKAGGYIYRAGGTDVAISDGGTNASSFTQTNGIVAYDGTRLVNYAGPQLDSSGRYTNTTQPAFSASLSAAVTNVTGDGTTYTVLCDTENVDQGSAYNNLTGVFTAPVTGVYHFAGSVQVDSLTAAFTGGVVFIQTTAKLYIGTNLNAGAARTAANSVCLPISLIVKMTAGDTAQLQINISGSTKTVGVLGGTDGNTYFTGNLIC